MSLNHGIHFDVKYYPTPRANAGKSEEPKQKSADNLEVEND